MHILPTLFRPVLWTSYLFFDICYLLVHDTAVRFFTLTHQFIGMGEKAQEISNITLLIEELEKEDKGSQEIIQQLLWGFCQHHSFNIDPGYEHLLEALKTYRYSLRALWHGLKPRQDFLYPPNQDLLLQMHGYLLHHKDQLTSINLPEGSPYKTSKNSSTSLATKSAACRQLTFDGLPSKTPP